MYVGYAVVNSKHILYERGFEVMRKFKSISLVIAIVALVAAMAVTVSAAASISIGSVEKSIDKNNGEVTFTVPYTSNDVEQITLLATKGTKDGSLPETDENILYVDQQDATVGQFTFKVDLDKFTADAPYIYIKIGGTAIDTADPADGILIVEDEVGICVYGDVTGDNNINIEDVVLLVKYLGLKASGSDLDPAIFPDGKFPGGADSGNVTGDDLTNIEDVVLLVKYLGLKASGSELDPAIFPDGKFPAYQK